MKYLKYICLILFIILALVTFEVANASDLSTALYRAIVSIYNSGDDATNVCAVFSANTTEYQDNDYINASCNNTAMLSPASADVPYMPGYAGNVWCVYVEEITADTTINDSLYMGGPSSLSGKIRYFPGDTGMVIPDDATLEPSDNASIALSGYIDTDTVKCIANKFNAVRVFTYSGNISAGISENGTAPTSNSDPSAQWTNETNAYDANIATYSESDPIVAEAWSGYLHLSHAALYCDGIRYYASSNQAGDDEIEIDVYYDTLGEWHNIESGVITESTWIAVSLNSTASISDIRIRCYNAVGGVNENFNIHEVEYLNLLTSPIISTAVTSGEHDVDVTIGEDVALGFDGSTYVDIGDVTFFDDASKSRTFVFTIKTVTPTAPSYQMIFDKNAAGLAGWSITYNANTGRIAFLIDATVGAGQLGVSATTVLTNNTWYQVAITYDGSKSAGNVNIYLNKVPETEIILSNTLGSNDISNASPAQFGARQATYYHRGFMADMQVYDKVLSLGEIAAIYDNGEPSANITANLIRHWKFLDGSGTTLTEEIAGNDGTITNGVWYDYEADRFSLWVDGVREDSLLGDFEAPGNSHNWYFCDPNATPYIESAGITVDGTPADEWEWEYAATFTGSVTGNVATPSFRTDSSDADVTANISSFRAIETALAPAYAVADAPTFYTETITASSNFTAGNVTGSSIPGSDVVDAAAEAASAPNIWLWGILGLFVIMSGSLFISYLERTYGGGGGTMIIRMIWHCVVLGALISFGKFDWWMMVFYLMIGGAVAMMSRHSDTGGLVSQYGLIGFLAQTWLGFTLVNRILQGQLLTTNEQTWANYFAFTQEFKAFDVFTMPVLNLEFFTHGIPSLLRWDYSIFGGNAILFQYLLYSFTAVVSFILFTVIIGLLYNAFRIR